MNIHDVNEIAANGYFDAADELEVACMLEALADSISNDPRCQIDTCTLKDAAQDIRYLVKLVQDFSKKDKPKRARPVSSVTPRFYKADDVSTLLAISKGSIYRMAANGEFPKPIKICDRSSGFDKEAVDAWIDKKIKGGK
ncbi:MAG: AlpA family phage regulatory protein [Methylophaga sp.]|nr:AlpA family phage regulatory protein [Methylophaga sp.]